MSGCTAFLINMTTTPDAKLVKADPHKLASKYLPQHPWGPDWVRMSLHFWKHRGR